MAERFVRRSEPVRNALCCCGHITDSFSTRSYGGGLAAGGQEQRIGDEQECGGPDRAGDSNLQRLPVNLVPTGVGTDWGGSPHDESALHPGGRMAGHGAHEAPVTGGPSYTTSRDSPP